MKRFLFALLFGVVCISLNTNILYAQQQVLLQNLSNVKADELSNDQLLKIRSQLNDAGIKDEQLRDALVSRGMQGDEADKVITRLSTIKSASNSTDLTTNPNVVNTVEGVQSNSYEPVQEALNVDSLPIFGSALFNQSNSPFNPNLNITPTDNYVIGPRDALQVNVTGVSVVSWDLTVNPSGYIFIPEGIGKVYIGGKTLADAKELIKAKLVANNYPIGEGANLDVSITNIRMINISIIGEARKPGNYQVSSMQTVFNALYLSGGPNKIGSFRNISVIRNNQVVENIDIYDFLLNGDVSHNIRLEENDMIRIPVYDVRVEITGEVKRPGVYEVLPGETLKNVIHFAGGVTDNAYTARIKIIQPTDKEKKVIDIGYKDFDNYIPLRGDHIMVDPIIDRVENRVTINGAVFRPGEYELTNGLTLKQLIDKGEGLKEDAFMSRGYITRLKPDNTQEIIAFDVKEIEEGQNDIALKREDVVTIPSIFDLKDNPVVRVYGRIRKPGILPYLDGMTVRDVILQSGGFAEGASVNRIEIAQRNKTVDRSKSDAEMAKIFKINVDSSLSTKEADFKLEPYDIISIYSLPGYEGLQNVQVEGEVIYPGSYTILKKNERISDVINRSGGLTPFAYVQGASLVRAEDTGKTSIGAKIEQVKRDQIINAQQDASDTSHVNINFNDPTVRNDFVGIDLSYIMAHPGSNQDLILQDGDVLNIPKLQQTVKVSGEVLWPTTILYESGKSLREYIVNSGGYTQDALRRKARVIGANGKAATTKSLLFFKRYPKIKPGSEIFVPRKKDNSGNAMTPQAWIGLGTSMASLVAIVFAIFNSSK